MQGAEKTQTPTAHKTLPISPQTSEGDIIQISPLAKEEGSSYYKLPPCGPPRKSDASIIKFVSDAVTYRTQPPVDPDPKQAEAYSRLVRAISRKEDPSLLRTILIALRVSGNTLHLLSGNPAKHAQLLHNIIQFNPFDPGRLRLSEQAALDEANRPFHDFSIADAFFHLMLALVSANSVFLVTSMTSLWKLLAGLSRTSLSDSSKEHRTQRIHATIAAMTMLCPKGKNEIVTIIMTNFPFKTRPKHQLVWCYRQSLEVAEYVPAMNELLLRFMIEKCLEMDVEIKVLSGGKVVREENDGALSLDQIMMDSVTHTNRRQDDNVYDMIEKLDALLLLTFQFVEAKGAGSIGGLRSLYECCMASFESAILITHQSKFVQFLIFYICGLESQLLEGNMQQHATLNHDFAADLIKITFDPYRSTVVRQSAACYLASFVSRAKFVEADTAIESVCALLKWANAYIASVQENGLTTSADVWDQCIDIHSLFYTICQAAFYIMCFRGPEVMKFYRSVTKTITTSTPGHFNDLQLHHIDIGPSRWQHLCGHSLQPMMYCAESVRCEFLKFASAFGLLNRVAVAKLSAAYLPHNKEAFNAAGGAVATSCVHGLSLNKAVNPLKSFFPFDPLLLELSHTYVKPFYRKWSEECTELLEKPVANQVNEDDNEESVNEQDDKEVWGEGEDDNELEVMDSFVGIVNSPHDETTEVLKRNRGHSIDSAGSW
ncbi:specific transcription initiation factor RRN3 [Seminavis robusta]|uniref:Specific transcription initiation factor RRN3 n=1 Tax=Seminavis robusta TaxID=568900 RepID=A0A9N8EBH3_9STRA|nr:specific transcription initiation factor RRN3 [Seminavis robusta]|eukprot:Sro925_g220850.1 specific transcription initiation factor RRN3 (715) ;mRNA; r:9679-12065